MNFLSLSIIEFLGLIGLGVALALTFKRLRASQAAHTACQEKLSTISKVNEAANQLQICKNEILAQQRQHEELTTKSQAMAAYLKKLLGQKQQLESTVKKYMSVAGDFKSVAALRKRLAELEQRIGLYTTVDELQSLINTKQCELQDYADAIGVAANARELLNKVTYYQNLVAELQSEVESIEETLDLQHFGVYRPHYSFDTSEEYKKEMDRISAQRKQMIKAQKAVVIPPGITVAGDERAGRQLGEEYAKAMLRAFNGEADADILKAKYNNMNSLETRMRKSRDQINKLGRTMQIYITDDYLELRIQELRLAYERQRKKQKELEEQAFLREQAREEERARREAEQAEQEAAELEQLEQSRLAEKEKLLAELRREFQEKKQQYECNVVMSKEQHDELKALLATQETEIANLEVQRDTLITAVHEAHERRVRAISLAEMTRRGYVYILSNIGSFGRDWFKIGMTRREDPQVRVRELASASVPFPFDIHAMVLTDDAPALEYALHDYFWDRRVNKVNDRKEFFEVTIQEIQEAIKEICPLPVEFRQIIPEAAEYRESEAVRREEVQNGARKVISTASVVPN